jgi:hypothetical protein
MKKSELKALIKECIVEESKNTLITDTAGIANYVNKHNAHFSAFLTPKKTAKNLNVQIKGESVIITPDSGSFTLTVDTDESKIKTTGKPTKGMESVSYVELITGLGHTTEFPVVDTKEA